MDSRDALKPNADGSAFPREKNGYAVKAVNDYIAETNRRFDDTVYDYKRQIYELKRELDEIKAGNSARDEPEPADITRAEELTARLSEAQALAASLTGERDELLRQVAELSADAVRIRVEAELAERRLFEQGECFYEIKANENVQRELKAYSEPDGDPEQCGGYSADIEKRKTDAEPGAADSVPVGGQYRADEGTGESNDWPTLSEAVAKADEFVTLAANETDTASDNDDSEIGGSPIYEIKPADANEDRLKEQAEITIADAARRSAELIAEAREEAKRLLREAEDESEHMRAELLNKANEEARVIRRETYLRTRLMLERISRKLNVHVDDCCRIITGYGLETSRELSDRLVKLRVNIDDINYSAEDSAEKILSELENITV